MTMMAVAPTTAPSTPPGALADVIRSLSRMSDRVEVLNALPPMATRLGFDRAIVSEVVEGCWAPSAVYVPRDRPWADDIREAGRSAPQALGVGMAEDEMLQSRRPVAVRQVRGNPRVHQGIAQVSRSQGYLAAPVAVGDRLGAILHVDRFWTRAPFGVEDAATSRSSVTRPVSCSSEPPSGRASAPHPRRGRHGAPRTGRPGACARC